MSTIELGDLTQVRDEPPARGRPGRRTWRAVGASAVAGLLLTATGAAVDEPAVEAYVLPHARFDSGATGWGDLVAYIDGAQRKLVVADLARHRTLWTHDSTPLAWVEHVGDNVVFGERPETDTTGWVVTVLDPRTGAERWHERLRSLAVSPAGDRLLVRTETADAWRIDGRDLATGRSSWSVRVPVGSQFHYPDEGPAGREFLVVPPDRYGLAVDYTTGAVTPVGRVPAAEALSLYGDQLSVLGGERSGSRYAMYALHDLAGGPLWSVDVAGGSGRPNPCAGGLLCYGQGDAAVRVDPRTGRIVEHLARPDDLVLTAAARSWLWIDKGPYATDESTFVVSTLAPRVPGRHAWLGLAHVDGAAVTFTPITPLPAEVRECGTTEAWLLCSFAEGGMVAYRRADVDALARRSAR
ncbi:PQQ-binding-like beta-propeller repeat protein [Hamadaea tsunoensis]|uniref:PQQ-binding-like beta-propeller repeat protein n=1 Tax=Hamadaea tsunoensis TaxID=53368 RepID=UPI00040B65AA|nr:PQQ-binding-like beta-propeller repeat protein [Hamadaea tsunoensis]